MANAKKRPSAKARATPSSARSRTAARTKASPRAAADRRELLGLLREVDAIVRPDPSGALELVCRAWRIQRATRLAELAELIEQRVPEAPPAGLAEAIAQRRAPALRAAVRSVAETSAGKAAGVLAGRIWKDPRLAWILLELLARPPWRSLPAVACYQVCLDEIVDAGDVRIVEPLAELGARYTAVIPTSVGVKVARRIEAAVVRLGEATAWPALAPACDEACDRIAAQLAPEVAAAGAKRARSRADHERHAELQHAIFQAPEDDVPRAVYADWLSELGDPRGELINLQLARARGVTDEAARARELELLTQAHAEKWLGALAPVVFDSDQVYARGFTAYTRLWKNKAALPSIVDQPAWGTVETIAIGDWATAGLHGQEALIELVCGPRPRALRALVNFPVAVLGALAERDGLARIERVEAIDLDSPELVPQLARWLRTATRPRAISFDTTAWNAEPSDLSWLVELPRFDALERVFLARTQISQANVARLEATALPRLRLHTYHDVNLELARSPGATRFDRVRVWRQIPPSWLDGPRAMLDGDDVLGDIALYLRDRAVTVDTRAPFVPGSAASRRPVRSAPTDALLARLGELATSVTVETGWHDALPEMIWN